VTGFSLVYADANTVSDLGDFETKVWQAKDPNPVSASTQHASAVPEKKKPPQAGASDQHRLLKLEVSRRGSWPAGTSA